MEKQTSPKNMPINRRRLAVYLSFLSSGVMLGTLGLQNDRTATELDSAAQTCDASGEYACGYTLRDIASSKKANSTEEGIAAAVLFLAASGVVLSSPEKTPEQDDDGDDDPENSIASSEDPYTSALQSLTWTVESED